MGRKNQFSTPKAIRANFKPAGAPKRHAGVPVYMDASGLWVDDSYRHIQVIGNTGEGKSQGAVLNFERDCIHRGESLIVLNSKDEDVRQLAGHVPDHYRKYYIDFNNPYESPDYWNPFAYSNALLHSEDPRDRDMARDRIHDFASALLETKDFKDIFWPSSGADYLKGLLFGLSETAEPQHVNLETLDLMMRHGEAKFGNQTYTRAFYHLLPEDSLAKSNLAVYVFAPNETRMSIFATARLGLSIFGLNQGLRQLLMRDTLDIAHLDAEQPFAIFITIPQQEGIYSTLAGLLVSQLLSHLQYLANRRPDRCLPIRTHLVLEEISKVGHAIPALPEILAVGRSKGMRVMMVMQSARQLAEVYGQTKADAINACSDIKICFSTSCSQTLQQWSDDCGMTEEIVNGMPRAVPLIAPWELRGMDVGEALIMTKNMKFRTHLPLYYQLTAGQSVPEPNFVPHACTITEPLDFRELVKNHKRKELENSLSHGTATGPNKRNADGSLMKPPMLPTEADEDDPLQLEKDFFLKLPKLHVEDDFEIEEKEMERPLSIKEVNDLFKRKRNMGALLPKEKMPQGYNTIILDPGKTPREVARLVAVMLSITFQEAKQRLESQDELVSIPFNQRYEAEEAQRRLSLEGATVVVAPRLNQNP